MSPGVFRNTDAFDGEAIDVWSAGTDVVVCGDGESLVRTSGGFGSIVFLHDGSLATIHMYLVR